MARKKTHTERIEAIEQKLTSLDVDVGDVTDAVETVVEIDSVRRRNAGVRTTEFKVVALAVLAGFAMIVVGVLDEQPGLTEHGTSLVTWATVGYAGARAATKLRPGG